MHASALGLLLLLAPADSVRVHQWELPLAGARGDTMYTDLSAIEQVGPHLYRAWSRYVYPNPTDNSVEALVQKEYDCERRTRRILSAVFYDANHAVTWSTSAPGRPSSVARKGRRQWSAVCTRAEGGVLARLVEWLRTLLQ